MKLGRALTSVAVAAVLVVGVGAAAPADVNNGGPKKDTKGAKWLTFNSVLLPAETKSVTKRNWVFATTADTSGNCQVVTIENKTTPYIGASDYTGTFKNDPDFTSVFVGPNASSEGAATTIDPRQNVAAIIASNDDGGSGKCWTSGTIF